MDARSGCWPRLFVGLGDHSTDQPHRFYPAFLESSDGGFDVIVGISWHRESRNAIVIRGRRVALLAVCTRDDRDRRPRDREPYGVNDLYEECWRLQTNRVVAEVAGVDACRLLAHHNAE